jgi:cytochrome c oxidase subunit 3
MPMAARRLQLQFDDLAKQRHAALLGMWLFLGSEILLFSGLFALYGGYRATYGAAFAEAVGHTTHWAGVVMTLVLLTSSLAVAMAVEAAREDRRRALVAWLTGAIALGILFLCLKGYEYSLHFADGILPGVYYRYDKLPPAAGNTFFNLYYLMTGLHALHVFGGVTALSVLAWLSHRGRYGADDHLPVETVGMYWHLVDVIWLFLWPMFYLLGSS